MTWVNEFSQALIDAHHSDRRVDAKRFPVPDYSQALEIQQQVQSTLGSVGGFKVARRAGKPPVMAPIHAGYLVPSGAEIAIRKEMGVELEIGFELISDSEDNLIETPRCHFCPRIVLELVDTRLEGGENDSMLKLADMQINAGLVVGPPLLDWDGEDFCTVNAELTCGAQQVINGPVTVPGGSALTLLAHFLRHVGGHCGGLQKGQIVITGSLSGLRFFPAGTTISGSIAGFGEVSCRFV